MKHLTLAICLLAAAPAQADAPRYFGYAAVECGLDDLHTPDVIEDGYTAEVSGFTNLNMACVHEDPAVTATRIRRLAEAGGDVLLNVQAALFESRGRNLVPSAARDLLWPLVIAGIGQSGIPTDRIVLYVVDEPALRDLPLADLSDALDFVKQTYPEIRTMVVDALDQPYPEPPAGLTYWGFFDYFHRDPAKVPEYVAALDRASALLRPEQGLVMVMDATHFWLHAEQGFAPEDMAGVARAYADLALSRDDIAVVMAYSWVGGIDDVSELGVRDMPPQVAQAHREIGLKLLGR